MTFKKKEAESAQAPPSGCGGSDDRGEGKAAARAGGEPECQPRQGAPTRKELSNSVRHSYNGFKCTVTGWAEEDFVRASKRS